MSSSTRFGGDCTGWPPWCGEMALVGKAMGPGLDCCDWWVWVE